MKVCVYFLHAGKKDVKSRKGNDAQNLHRKKKRDGMVTRRKPKKESKLQENFQDKLNLNNRKKIIYHLFEACSCLFS
jgi:hypothetical protein